MFKFRFNLLQLGEGRLQTKEDGYFGWTDRYGVRTAAFADEQSKPRTRQRPYFLVDYPD